MRANEKERERERARRAHEKERERERKREHARVGDACAREERERKSEQARARTRGENTRERGREKRERERGHACEKERERERVHAIEEKICSECGAESSPAGLWLPSAGRGRAWAARTDSGPMLMCGDIFAQYCCIAAVEGQFADNRTSVLPPSNCRVCGTCREGRCGGAVGSVGVLRAMCCHLRAGFQQCKSFVEMGTVR